MDARTLQEVRISTINADGRGRVPVYCKLEGKWIWRYPVDAREIVAMGLGEMDPSSEEAPPRPTPHA
jgi:hypothetical protein